MIRLVRLVVGGLFTFMAIGLSGPVSAAADPGTWERLGVQQVNANGGQDVLTVTAADGRFEALQIRVARSAMDIYSLRVHFGDGTMQDVDMQQSFSAGASSRLIEFPGGKKIVEKIDFKYGNVEQGRRPARLAVWGRR